ncbi:uncharacterized protein [Branchiostoma lanceolatum]|uniref:uncharacterized protein n=1 Tax=Branchiostoma lanceolatum TaxID=7740 RepID=UPI0034559166
MALDYVRAMLRPNARRRYNEGVFDRCKEGDLLEFHRRLYSHWAVYVGDGMVIHRIEVNGRVKIREDRFWDVAGNDMVSINNYLDSIKAAKPGHEIVQRARSRQGDTCYNLMSKNCEHFANWCRYDVTFSRQATLATTVNAGIAAAGMATGIPPLVAIGLGVQWLMTKTSWGVSYMYAYGTVKMSFFVSSSSSSSSMSRTSGNWMNPSDARRNNEDVAFQCTEGDLLQFPREGGFSHWAVYVGRGWVIHLLDDGKVQKDRFWDVVGDSLAKINNYLDGEMNVLPREEIVKRARSKLGEMEYNLVSYNCEHFATWCRNGVARSQQVCI